MFAASIPPPLCLEEGTLLAGKYRLDRVAGFGGMAQLWVATNQSTGAEVCIKILPEGADSEASERFRREAHAAARLSHRAIVRIFDLVELGGRGNIAKDESPRALAIVMELLRGETLGDLLLARGGLPVDEAMDIAVNVVSALAHAHRAGIVHRDLKPDNVFLAKDPDGKVIPKVLDFGVSKVADGMPLTQDGVILGTPSYMSPEQARGARDIDARTDVFTAGILMYTMVAGRNPFEADSFSASVTAVLEREPPRPEGLGDAVWHVVERALSKKRADRYRDATELGIALRQATGRPTLTESGSFSVGRGTLDSETSVRPVTRVSTPDVAPSAPPPDMGGHWPPPVDVLETDLAKRRRRGKIGMGVVLVVGVAMAALGGAVEMTKAAARRVSTPPSTSETQLAPKAAAPPPVVASSLPAQRPAIAEAPPPVATAALATKPAAPETKPVAPKPKKPAEPAIARDPGF